MGRPKGSKNKQREQMDVALLNGIPVEFLRYSTKKEDYISLCRSHHQRYDGVGTKRRAHRESSVQSPWLTKEVARFGGAVGKCSRWNIQRGKPCTCGRHQ